MPQAINNWQMDQKNDLSQPAAKPKYISTFRALSGYIKPHRWAFIVVFICSLIAIAS
jgi:ATP-binding cassette subfamily B multidrug efflux pump